jgi:AP-4 complex subunit epsilon-1
MYETLREAMTRADIGINIGHAIVYECVTTITAIYPNNLLLENAAAAISRFVTSSNHNLKYLGIRALTEIVKINPKYATQHQMVVIDCLEDPDETLKRRVS